MTAVAPHIAAFFNDHLARERGASRHTCDAYAHTFKLLFELLAVAGSIVPPSLKRGRFTVPDSLIASLMKR